MSDVPESEQNLQWKLGIEAPSLSYAKKPAAEHVLFAGRNPYLLLKAWYDSTSVLKCIRHLH